MFYRDSTQSLVMVMGALYASCLFVGVNNSASVQPIVSVERTVFYRERAAGMYSPFPYAAAQVIVFTMHKIWLITFLIGSGGDGLLLFLCQQGLVEIPYTILQTIVFGVITFFMINFERTASKILNSWAALWHIGFIIVTVSLYYVVLCARSMLVTIWYYPEKLFQKKLIGKILWHSQKS